MPDEAKFQELLLYIAEKSVSDPDFGATKLNKMLFFCDFLCYAKLGEPLTGVEYQRLTWGPAPRRLRPLQRDLVDRHEAAIVPVSRGYTQYRLIALRSANLSRFSAEEVSLVDTVIEELRGLGAVDVSELSHSWSVAWQAIEDGATIPYDTVFWAPSGETPETAGFAQRVAKEFGLVDDASGSR